MAAMPEIEDPVAAAIYQGYVRAQEGPRAYLGGSQIGHACERALWYSFRGEREELDGRMLRLFDTGHREEARVIEDLRRAGLEVSDRTTDGKQRGFRLIGGHFRSHVDGVVLGVPDAPKTAHLLEVKTHNDKSFADLNKNGVQKSKPMHYAQMQVYMHGLGLERALYVAVEKSSDRIYTERVKLDPAFVSALLGKIERIIAAEGPPARITEDPAWYECKFCPHRTVCWGEKMPRRDCRTCALSTADAGSGSWHCDRWRADIPEEHLRSACDDHVYLPALVPGCEVQNAGPDEAPWVLYLHKESGAQFINGNPQAIKDSQETPPCAIVKSDALQDIDPALFGDKAFMSIVQNVGEEMKVIVDSINDSDIPFAPIPRKACHVV